MQAGRRTIAANFVRETMEDLYKREYGDTGLNATVDQPYPLPAGTAFGGEFLARYPTATRKYTITENPDYKLITVKVTWN